MLIRFYVSLNKERVWELAGALQTGAGLFGDRVEIVHNGEFAGPHLDVDVACCFGVFGNAKEIVRSYVGANKRVLMFDKALIRRMGAERYGHYRIGLDGSSPLKYLMRETRSFERWEAHGITLKPRQELTRRGEIVFCGSTQKYCDFHGLGEANDYAEGVFEATRKVSHKFFLVYRPKPSWAGAREIAGTRFSDGTGTLLKLLRNAHCLITHGSAAAVEAVVSGVPAITLGPCVARPVASHSIDELLNPFFPSDTARWHPQDFSARRGCVRGPVLLLVLAILHPKRGHRDRQHSNRSQGRKSARVGVAAIDNCHVIQASY
jgi:hypothetical protein